MLVLIVEENLTLAFVSADATAPFAPSEDALGRPLSDCTALMAADPDLVVACQDALAGRMPDPLTVSPEGDQHFMRAVVLRDRGDDGREPIITYRPDPDLTRRRLNAMRKRLAAGMEAATDAYGIYDADDVLVLCNPSYANLYPGPEGPLTTGMPFDAVLRRFIAHGGINLAPDAVEGWIARRKAERSNPYHVVEFRVPDGRFFRLVERDTLDGGRLRQMIDLTTLRQAERELHDVVIGAGVGTWSFDAATDRIRINRRFARILGYDPSDLTSLSRDGWRDMMHPKDRGGFDRAWAALHDSKDSRIDIELRMRAPDGRWIWCILRGGAADDHGKALPSRISGVLLDNTAQHQLQTDLLRRDAAITATSDGICITDDTGLIVDANPAMLRLLGHHSPQDVVGRAWSTLFSPGSAKELHDIVRDTLRRHGEWQGEALIHDQQGNDLEVELTLTETPDHSVIWMCRDVGARNEAARQLLAMRDNVQRAQRQESINLIAAGLTHDLTNLVALISHLSDSAMPGDFAEPALVLEEIHAAARQMVALLEPIKALGRRQACREAIDLAALLSEAAGILHIGAPRGLQIDTHVAQDALHVWADRMQLMQVLLNLGLNAREAVGLGAQTITLSLSRATAMPKGAKLETGVIPPAPFALFAVADTGPGMDAATRAKIWEPYFTTKTLSGTGLGLFVVADIVRAAGGGIALDTAAGHGTTFYIAWPLDQGA